MPILLRAASVADVEPGERKRVKVRGEKIWLVATGGALGAYGSECAHVGGDAPEPCRHYRVHVRGGWIYVALDPDSNAAPADVHLNDRDPTPAI